MPKLSSLLLKIPDEFKPAAALGIAALILVDLVLAAIFLAGFFCLCRGIVRQKRGMLLMAALLFAAGALTKPTLVLWPICVPVIWVVLARG